MNARAAQARSCPPPAHAPDATHCPICRYPLVFSAHRQAPPGWRAHVGRGLCSPCHYLAYREGVLDDYERRNHRRDDVLDDWEALRSAGVTRGEAARRLGMTVDAFMQHLYRGRVAGDVRARLGTA